MGILGRVEKTRGQRGRMPSIWKFQKRAGIQNQTHCKDRAGSLEQRVDYGDSEAPEQFVIDTTDPVAEIDITAMERRFFYQRKLVGEALQTKRLRRRL